MINRVTVWHDGDCPFCKREIALMRGLDTRRAITFAVDTHWSVPDRRRNCLIFGAFGASGLGSGRLNGCLLSETR